MHSIRRSLAAIGAIIALLALTPSAMAADHRPFHLEKTCAADASEPLGYICTIQNSNFRLFAPGTHVRYLSQNPTGDVVQARIEIKGGSTDGTCTWSDGTHAVCIFGGGTGRLARFHLDVAVTANADQSVWYWDGKYWFGEGPDRS